MASGWYRESRRHALASKGVKTAQSKNDSMQKAATYKPEEQMFYQGKPVSIAWKVDENTTQIVHSNPPYSHEDVPTKMLKTAKEEMKFKKQIEPFITDNWDEKTVNLALRRLNAGTIKPSEIFERNKALDSGDGVKLTSAQQKKGWDWLKAQHYTPTGKEKESSPYGYREVDIIDNADDIRLIDFYDTSRYGGMHYYVPLYRACSKNSCMDYYVAAGKINIVG